MRCGSRIQERMVSLAAGELPPAHAWLLRRHLRACDACRRDWEETRALWGGLREMASEPVPEAVSRRANAALPDLSFPPLLAVRAEISAQPGVRWAGVGAVGAVLLFAVCGLAVTRWEERRAARPPE